MDCQEMDLIESRSERSNFGILLLFDNFLKNGLIMRPPPCLPGC